MANATTATFPPYLAMNDTTSSPFSSPLSSTSSSSSPAGNGSRTMMDYSMGELMNMFARTGVLAEQIVPPIWYVIGFLGNAMSAIIWFGARMRRNNSSAVYLGSLAVSDFVFLLLHLLYNLHMAWGYDVYNVHAGCEVFMFFYYFPQYLSVVLVAAFTIERYVAVCHPFLKEKLCTVRRAFILMGICAACSLLLSSAQTFIWTYHPRLNACNYRDEAVEGDKASFMNVWGWVVDMSIFMGVPLVVLVFNALVLKEIIRLSKDGVISRQQNRSNGGNNTASTLTLLSVSFFLIVTQVTATVVANLQGAFPTGDWHMTAGEAREDPAWSRLFTYLAARKIIDMVCLSHFACYFFVYCLTGKHFRREVMFLLTCHGRLHCVGRLLATTGLRKERYSMVSTNGHTLATDTCSTAFTTNM